MQDLKTWYDVTDEVVAERLVWDSAAFIATLLKRYMETHIDKIMRDEVSSSSLLAAMVRRRHYHGHLYTAMYLCQTKHVDFYIDSPFPYGGWWKVVLKGAFKSKGWFTPYYIVRKIYKKKFPSDLDSYRKKVKPFRRVLPREYFQWRNSRIKLMRGHCSTTTLKHREITSGKAVVARVLEHYSSKDIATMNELYEAFIEAFPDYDTVRKSRYFLDNFFDRIKLNNGLKNRHFVSYGSNVSFRTVGGNNKKPISFLRYVDGAPTKVMAAYDVDTSGDENLKKQIKVLDDYIMTRRSAMKHGKTIKKDCRPNWFDFDMVVCRSWNLTYKYNSTKEKVARDLSDAFLNNGWVVPSLTKWSNYYVLRLLDKNGNGKIEKKTRSLAVPWGYKQESFGNVFRRISEVLSVHTAKLVTRPKKCDLMFWEYPIYSISFRQINRLTKEPFYLIRNYLHWNQTNNKDDFSLAGFPARASKHGITVEKTH